MQRCPKCCPSVVGGPTSDIMRPLSAHGYAAVYRPTERQANYDLARKTPHRSVRARAVHPRLWRPRPPILFVDGLAGSGKSMSAAEFGRRCRMAEFSKAPLEPSVARWGARQRNGSGVRHDRPARPMHLQQYPSRSSMPFWRRRDLKSGKYCECHPLQSTVRVLLQLKALEPELKFWIAWRPWRLGCCTSGQATLRQAMEATLRQRVSPAELCG
jgi:hypothetical protein